MSSIISKNSKNLDLESKIRLSEIDNSMKRPCLFFISASIIWLIIGTLFALIAVMISSNLRVASGADYIVVR